MEDGRQKGGEPRKREIGTFQAVFLSVRYRIVVLFSLSLSVSVEEIFFKVALFKSEPLV